MSDVKKCGHHGTVLIDLGPEKGWRCPHCFPDMFPPCAEPLVLSDWLVPYTDLTGREVRCVAPRGHDAGPEGTPHRAEVIWR